MMPDLLAETSLRGSAKCRYAAGRITPVACPATGLQKPVMSDNSSDGERELSVPLMSPAKWLVSLSPIPNQCGTTGVRLSFLASIVGQWAQCQGANVHQLQTQDATVAIGETGPLTGLIRKSDRVTEHQGPIPPATIGSRTTKDHNYGTSRSKRSDSCPGYPPTLSISEMKFLRQRH